MLSGMPPGNSARLTLALVSEGKHVHRRQYEIQKRSTPPSQPEVIRLAAHIQPAKKRALSASWIARERQHYFARVDRMFGRLAADYWSKRELRAEQQMLVAKFLAKAGRWLAGVIQKIPTRKSGQTDGMPRFNYGRMDSKSNSDSVRF